MSDRLGKEPLPDRAIYIVWIIAAIATVALLEDAYAAYAKGNIWLLLFRLFFAVVPIASTICLDKYLKIWQRDEDNSIMNDSLAPKKKKH